MHDVSWFRVVPFAREQGQIFILTPEKLDLDETVVRSMVITFAFVHSLFAYNWPGQEKTGGRLKKKSEKAIPVRQKEAVLSCFYRTVPRRQ